MTAERGQPEAACASIGQDENLQRLGLARRDERAGGEKGARLEEPPRPHAIEDPADQRGRDEVTVQR